MYGNPRVVVSNWGEKGFEGGLALDAHRWVQDCKQQLGSLFIHELAGGAMQGLLTVLLMADCAPLCVICPFALLHLQAPRCWPSSRQR